MVISGLVCWKLQTNHAPLEWIATTFTVALLALGFLLLFSTEEFQDWKAGRTSKTEETKDPNIMI